MPEAQGFLGAGDVYMDRQVNGVYTGRKGPFSASRFEIKANSELKEKQSRGRATYGQVVASAALPRPFDLNITFDNLDSEGLALALMGTVGALSQSSGTVSNEAVDGVVRDTWISLSKAAISSVVVSNTAGSTTYVAGTDYLVNPQMGWIKVLPTGAITEGQDLLVDFSHDAITGKEIKGAVQPIIRARFVFDGVNFADGLPVIVTVHEAAIASDAAIDFLSEDFGEVPLPGRMVTPAGFTEPFTIHKRGV